MCRSCFEWPCSQSAAMKTESQQPKDLALFLWAVGNPEVFSCVRPQSKSVFDYFGYETEFRFAILTRSFGRSSFRYVSWHLHPCPNKVSNRCRTCFGVCHSRFNKQTWSPTEFVHYTRKCPLNLSKLEQTWSKALSYLSTMEGKTFKTFVLVQFGIDQLLQVLNGSFKNH